jgi:hypothetical protein
VSVTYPTSPLKTALVPVYDEDRMRIDDGR